MGLLKQSGVTRCGLTAPGREPRGRGVAVAQSRGGGKVGKLTPGQIRGGGGPLTSSYGHRFPGKVGSRGAVKNHHTSQILHKLRILNNPFGLYNNHMGGGVPIIMAMSQTGKPRPRQIKRSNVASAQAPACGVWLTRAPHRSAVSFLGAGPRMWLLGPPTPTASPGTEPKAADPCWLVCSSE